MKRLLFIVLLSLMIFIGFNLGGCNSGKVIGMAFVSNGANVNALAVSRNGISGDEFTLYTSEHVGEDKAELWRKFGDYRGLLVGIGNHKGREILIFRDGAVMAADFSPSSAFGNKNTSTSTDNKTDNPADNTDLKPANIFQPVIEGSGAYKFVDAALWGDSLLAVSIDDAKMPHLLFCDLSAEAEKVWNPLPVSLPVLSAPALARCSFYRDEPVFFWRESREGFPAAGLRGAWLKDGVWKELPAVPPPLLQGNFALFPYGDKLLLLQQSTFSESSEKSRIYVNSLDDAGWSAYSPIALKSPLQGLGGGISLSIYENRVLVALSSLGEVQVFTTDNVKAANWRPFGFPGAEDKESLPMWYFTLLLLFSTLAFFFAWRAAKLRAPNGTNSAADAARNLAQSMHGRPATIFMRAMSMFFDAALVLPLPLIYIGSTDSALRMIAQGRQFVPYFIWLGGLAVYSAIAEGLYGQTVGKKLLGLRVRSVSGHPASWGSAVIRNLLRGIDFFPVPIGGADIWYLVAFVTAAFSRQRQRLGDMLASTVVVRFIPLKKRRIILASASPRRRELLQEMGYEFEVKTADINENIIPDIEPERMALQLARQKAEKIALSEKIPTVIIAADTIVVHDGGILGKPESREEAVRMLQSLSGNAHRVITAVCVIDTAAGAFLEGADTTVVSMREISQNEIEAYVATGESDDKAGAYAIQGGAGDFVIELGGSLSNVIGLPVEMLTQMLSEID